jgi:hypothetical protein
MPLTGMVEDMADGATARQTGGRLHHFLLPASGWGSAVEAKEAAELAPVAAAALKEWRKSVVIKPSRGAERTATNQAGHTYIYELPFRLLDREADMRTAYAEFERRLAAHG